MKIHDDNSVTLTDVEFATLLGCCLSPNSSEKLKFIDRATDNYGAARLFSALSKTVNDAVSGKDVDANVFTLTE